VQGYSSQKGGVIASIPMVGWQYISNGTKNTNLLNSALPDMILKTRY
jgi:hypothetical protein